MVIKGYQNQGSNGNISFQCHYGTEIVIGTTGVENRRSIPVAITNKARTASKLTGMTCERTGMTWSAFSEMTRVIRGQAPLDRR